MRFLSDWVDGAAGAAFWVCFTWPLLVSVFWPWWKAEWGWNMVIKTELIALAFLPGILKLEFGVSPGFGLLVVEVVAITLIPIVVLWRTWIIWKSQRAGARDSHDHAAAAPAITDPAAE